MNYKFAIAVVLVAIGLNYSGVGPSELLDRGVVFWENFSSDFKAIFDGKPNAVNGAQTYADSQMQAICNIVPESSPDAETSEITNDINNTRCEAAKAAQAIILDPDALKKRMEEIKQPIE